MKNIEVREAIQAAIPAVQAVLDSAETASEAATSDLSWCEAELDSLNSSKAGYADLLAQAIADREAEAQALLAEIQADRQKTETDPVATPVYSRGEQETQDEYEERIFWENLAYVQPLLDAIKLDTDALSEAFRDDFPGLIQPVDSWINEGSAWAPYDPSSIIPFPIYGTGNVLNTMVEDWGYLLKAQQELDRIISLLDNHVGLIEGPVFSDLEDLNDRRFDFSALRPVIAAVPKPVTIGGANYPSFYDSPENFDAAYMPRVSEQVDGVLTSPALESAIVRMNSSIDRFQFNLDYFDNGGLAGYYNSIYHDYRDACDAVSIPERMAIEMLPGLSNAVTQSLNALENFVSGYAYSVDGGAHSGIHLWDGSSREVDFRHYFSENAFNDGLSQTLLSEQDNAMATQIVNQYLSFKAEYENLGEGYATTCRAAFSKLDEIKGAYQGCTTTFLSMDDAVAMEQNLFSVVVPLTSGYNRSDVNAVLGTLGSESNVRMATQATVDPLPELEDMVMIALYDIKQQMADRTASWLPGTTTLDHVNTDWLYLRGLLDGWLTNNDGSLVRILYASTANGLKTMLDSQREDFMVATSPPQIVQQPVSGFVYPNGTYQLSVQAERASQYQWYSSVLFGALTPIVGATSSVYIAPDQTVREYRCEVTNQYGSNWSASAEVAQARPPQIFDSAYDRSVSAGGSTTLETMVWYGGAQNVLSYQWYVASSEAGPFTTIAGEMSTHLALHNLQQTRWYYMLVTNQWGSTPSAHTKVSVIMDSDGDGVQDDIDNCPQTQNPVQRDFDRDQIGDTCDPDDDNDGMSDAWEKIYNFNPFNASDAFNDPDKDGLNNFPEFKLHTNPLVYDVDSDHDGVPDDVEKRRAALMPVIMFLLAE